MSETMIRWSGLPLIAGAILLGASIVLTPAANPGFPPLVSYLFLLATTLLLLAVDTFYAPNLTPSGNIKDWTVPKAPLRAAQCGA